MISERPYSEILAAFQDPKAWPTWHHFTRRVEILPAPTPSRAPRDGDRLELSIAPRNYSWRLYHVRVQVERWQPPTQIQLRLLEDESGKIPKQFRDLEWTMSIRATDPKHTLISGRLTATTASAKSRLFCRLSPRLLLNQIFYPNLFALGGQESSEGIELTPH